MNVYEHILRELKVVTDCDDLEVTFNIPTLVWQIVVMVE